MILRLPNSIVIVSPKGINNNVVGKGVSIAFWPWKDISYFSSTLEIDDERPIETLSLHSLDGQVLATFGLSRKITLNEIEAYVQHQRKTLHREEHSSSGSTNLPSS